MKHLNPMPVGKRPSRDGMHFSPKPGKVLALLQIRSSTKEQYKIAEGLFIKSPAVVIYN